MFLHQIPWAKVRQAPYSLFKPLFSGCICKEVISVKDTKAKQDSLMGTPEQSSREKVYIFHQNQEVEGYGPSSESNLNFKLLIMAQVSRIVGYFFVVQLDTFCNKHRLYFKFW